MKLSFTFSLLLIICSCQSPETRDNPPEEIDESKLTEMEEVALNFINSYVKFNKESEIDIGILEWTNQRKDVTPNFKNKLQSIIIQAERRDPELGLGFDPIFDAQDFPEKGFVFDTIKDDFVVVRGKVWQDFTLHIKLKEKDKSFLVDGCGIINIREENRASR